MKQSDVLQKIADDSTIFYVSANAHPGKYDSSLSVERRNAVLPRNKRTGHISSDYLTAAKALIKQGLIARCEFETFQLTALGAEKLGIDLNALLYTAVKAEYEKVLEYYRHCAYTWERWTAYRHYGENKRIVCDNLMTRQCGDFSWIRYEGLLPEYSYMSKVSFLSPNTDRDNMLRYDLELQILERCLAALENGYSL